MTVTIKQIYSLKLPLIYCLSGPSGIYLLEISNISSRIKWEICSELRIETQDVVLLSLLSTFNIFGKLFY